VSDPTRPPGPKIIAVANQKGGVGKTTTSVNLAASLSETGRRILLIDLDAQGNATMGSGVNKHEVPRTGYELLLGQAGIRDIIVYAEEAGYDLLPGNSDLTAAEVELMGKDNRERRLRAALAYVQHDYDLIIIDCPPSLSMLTVNALAAAHGVLIPIQCEYFAMEGLALMIDVIRQIMERPDKRLQFGGIVLTMYDPTLELTHEVEEEVREFFGEIVFHSVIPRDVAVSEAPSHGLPVLQYAPRSRGTRAYIELCMEVLEHD